MNSLFKNMQINQLSGRLRQIAGTPNVLSMQFSAVDVAGIRESIITIANECKADDPQIARQLLAAKDILFAVNQFGQAFINPYAIGEILFGLDYLAAKGQAPSAEKQTSLFSCLTSCKRARTEAFYARTRFYLNFGAVRIASGRYGSECPQPLAASAFLPLNKVA